MSSKSPSQTVERGASHEALIAEALPEFEASLDPRAKVPAQRVNEYLGVSDTRIRFEGERVAKILERFSRAVGDAMESTCRADDFLRELDLKSISRDHDWRRIFKELKARGPSYDGHKRAFLVKYLQYLSFRKRLLEFIYLRRLGLQETFSHELPAPGFAGAAARAGPSGAGSVAAATGDAEVERLPLGETVEVAIAPGATVELLLARRAFKLRGPAHPRLIDPNGVTHPLKQGRNMVGRHPESDIVVDQKFGDVSRAHAIMEWVSEGVIRLTDLSTRGTFVTPSALRHKA